MALNLAQKYKSKLILITCIERINGSWFGQDLTPAYQKEVKNTRTKFFMRWQNWNLYQKRKKLL